ncbi:MAG: hypothetical protein ACPGU1_10480 [Myxococcota bacterium]
MKSSRTSTLSVLLLISAVIGAQGCGSDADTGNDTENTLDVLSSGPSDDAAENNDGTPTEGDAILTDDSAVEGDSVTPADTATGPDEDATGPCVPNCEERVCGDDGCGGSCGSCVDSDDPCQDSVCDEGVCNSVPVEGSCDDDNLCTVDDICTEGVCSGTAMDCDDDNECTVNWCNQGHCMTEPSEEDACALSITINSPARAAILVDQEIVTVSGTVSSPAGLVDHITLNGEAIGVTNEGVFTTNLVPSFGLNTIVGEVSNSIGQEDQIAQSFLHGENFHPIGGLESPTMLSDAMGLWLSPAAFDDNDLDDVDDLSTLAFLILSGLDLNALIPNPLFAQSQRPSFLGCDYDVSVENVAMTVDEVEFLPVDGGLHAYFEFEDLYAYIKAESDDGIIGDNCADALGPVSATLITVDVKLTVNVVNGKPEVSIAEGDLTVTPYQFDWTIEDGLASLVDFLMPLVKGTIEDAIISAIEVQVQDSILPLVNGLLSEFTSFERIFAIPPLQAGGNSATLNLKVALDDATFSEAGVHLSLKVGSSSDDEIDVEVPGTLADAHCEEAPQTGLEKLPKSSAAEAYLDVDLSNQLLFSLWDSGFTHMTVTEDLLGDTTETYGLSNPEITIAPMMPPVLHTCTELGDAELQLGDIHVVAEFDTETGPLILDLFASATVGADLTVFSVPDAPDALGVETVTPGTIVLDLQEVTGNLAFSDEIIELLLAAIVSEVIAGDLLTGLIGAFPLPTVAVGNYVPGLDDAAALSFNPQTLEGVGAHLILGGELTAE